MKFVGLLQVLDLASLTMAQAQSVLGLKGQANFRDRYLEPALDSGLIEMTIPAKPTAVSRNTGLRIKGGLYWSLQNGSPKGLGALINVCVCKIRKFNSFGYYIVQRVYKKASGL